MKNQSLLFRQNAAIMKPKTLFFYDGQDFNDEHVLSPLVETVESFKSSLSVCTIVPNVEEFPDFQEN